ALAYSQEFEAEADYVALYIMARAGIPLENSADFWRRISTNDPEAITKYFLATHPSTPERFVAMEDTINEINLKITGNTELMPNINKNALQQREPVPRPEPQLMYAPR
ncbi:MAG: M48 family metalloprotease, partial [Gammaproteobacteria bacterium]